MSGSSSFYWSMRLLPRGRRDAMFALYDYCRVLDDIADGDEPADTRRAKLATIRGALAAWVETGIALHPVIAALAPHARLWALPPAELEALIAGMEMDVNGPLTAPGLDELTLYCRRVAGSVGLLAVRVFERPDAESFALSLAEALQLTNILRDVAEDAGRGRLYIPREVLEEAGMQVLSPRAVLTHPSLPMACERLAVMAEERFRAAEAELARIGRARLWPAVAMMATYRLLLRRLRRTGWTRLDRPPRLARWEKLAIAVRAAVAGP